MPGVAGVVDLHGAGGARLSHAHEPVVSPGILEVDARIGLRSDIGSYGE